MERTKEIIESFSIDDYEVECNIEYYEIGGDSITPPTYDYDYTIISIKDIDCKEVNVVLTPNQQYQLSKLIQNYITA